MRRIAIHFSIPVICTLLGIVLIGAGGSVGEAEPLPQLAMAVSPATTRPTLETLITSAPTVADVKRELIAMPPVPSAEGRVVMMEVTAYCACKKCCGPKAQGITASGRRVSYNNGLFVAADKHVFDFYTKLSIPGYAGGKPVPVLDRGGAIKGNKLDVYFASHQEALKWGRQTIPVTIVK